MELRNSCPYLGMRDDEATSLAYPSNWNTCYRSQPVARPTLSHQSRVCLSTSYDQCPVYTSEPGQKMPEEIRDVQKLPVWKRYVWVCGSLLVVLFLVAFLIWGLNKPKSPGMEGTATTSLSSSKSGTPLILKSETPHATLTKEKGIEEIIATATMMPSATKVPPSPTPEELHLLEIPIGKNFKFVIHRIAKGESVAQYADVYNTTAEAIEACNFIMPSIWSDRLVIIPVDLTDVTDLPAFEAYMVEQDSIIIEEIAKMLSVDAKEMRLYNDLETGHIMHSGDWLLIPRERQENN